MTPDALRAVLPVFGLAADVPLRLLNRSENETWMAGVDRLVLRVHRRGYHSQTEIMSEIAWLRALHDVPGLRCVRAVANVDGADVATVDGYFVTAFTPIAGREVGLQDDLVHWFGELGAVSRRLHDHARAWQRPAGFTRKRWDCETILGANPHWGDWRSAPGVDAS